ncbi:hypothetical protein [Methylobacterium radiotolerans]
MTEVTANAAVQAIMDSATAATSPSAILLLAVDLLKPGANWKGRRKLDREEAIAATRAITAMLRRYELKPTKVLIKAGRASEPGATSRFYLTQKEMEPGALITKRLATGLSAHLDNVRAISRHAREAGHEVDERTLFAELAEAVGPFLEQFRVETELDADAELARDIGLIPAWISDPRRGLELGRFLFEADRQDLCFDATTGEMDYKGEGARMHDGNMPVIPLLTRAVASAEAEIFVRDPDAIEPDDKVGILAFAREPKLKAVGRSNCIICQKVGLGIAPDRDRRGGLRVVFTLDPVTYVGLPVEERNGPTWMQRGYSKTLECAGIPIPGRRERVGDGIHWFTTQQPDRYLCREFETFVDRVYDDEHGWDEEQLWLQRWLPVTTETCAQIFDESNRRLIEAWRSFGDLVEDTVMPDVAVTDTGVESRTIRDRFAALLYASEEPSAAGLLLKEAELRTEALDRFTVRTATGERRLKLAYRARMRR